MGGRVLGEEKGVASASRNLHLGGCEIIRGKKLLLLESRFSSNGYDSFIGGALPSKV